jgi:hypothetical protein
MPNYLARLKVIVSETRLPRELSKRPEGAFDPFGSGQGRHVLKFEAATGAPDASLPSVPEPPAVVASLEERRAPWSACLPPWPPKMSAAGTGTRSPFKTGAMAASKFAAS